VTRQRVLITGVSRFWGTELAQRLETNPAVEQIVGIDVREPTADLQRTDFVRADIRHSLVGKLIRALGIDTVVHASLIVDPRRTSARVAHETNVIGTMNLMRVGLAGAPPGGQVQHRHLRQPAGRSLVLDRGHGPAHPRGRRLQP